MIRREALILAGLSVLLLLYFCAKEVVFLSKQFLFKRQNLLSMFVLIDE